MRVDRIFNMGDEQPAVAGSNLSFDVLQMHIGFAAHRVVLVLTREFVTQTGGVRPVVFNALVLTGANPGITQSELAAALMLDKGTAAHLLRDLEKQGWIERKTRLNDRRWKGVYLSPSGVLELARLKGEIRTLAERFHALYTPEEHCQLLELLNRIVKAVESRERLA
jgi:DNA-binding MarR family transcriptional regulator